MIEIRMHGRGGQGTVVASKILADAAFKDGKYVQSFPQFGVERRGAPVTAFLRISEDSSLFIRSHIYEPDHIIVLDPVLLEAVNVLEGLKEGGWVIANTHRALDQVKVSREFHLAVVDASSIAAKHALGSKMQPIVNTAILGAFSKATGIVSLESLLAAIKEGVPIKPENNAQAAKEAYETTKIR